MAQLRHYAPITREQEHALALRWVEERDRDAARQLVLANLRLVVKIAMEYRRAWTNVLDLIQEGNLGLLQATQRFDPYKGVKLSSYAVYWIRAYILKYILDNIRMVRLGKTRAERKLFFRLNKEKRELERQGFEAVPKLLAERLDVSESDVVDMEQRLSRNELSLQAPAFSDDDRREVGDMMPTRRRERRADGRRRRVASRLHGARARIRRRPRAARPPHRGCAHPRGRAALAAGARHGIRRVARARAPARGAHRGAAARAPEAQSGGLRVLRGARRSEARAACAGAWW